MRAHLFGFFGEGDSADPCASCSPGLNLNDNFVAQFLRSRGSFVGSRCGAAARNFESIRSENCFALILVKTRHDKMCRAILARFPAHARVRYLTTDGLIMAEAAFPHEARPHPRQQEPASLDRQRLYKIRPL